MKNLNSRPQQPTMMSAGSFYLVFFCLSLEIGETAKIDSNVCQHYCLDSYSASKMRLECEKKDNEGHAGVQEELAVVIADSNSC